MLFGSRARGANQPQDGAFLLRAPDQDLENEFVQGGVIDKFSLQFELGWKLLKALLAYEGDAACVTGSPRDIIKAASAHYDFMDEEVWLCMLRDRNNTVPVFDARSVFLFVQMAIQTYIPELVRLRDRLLARYPGHAGVLGDAFD